MEFRILGPVEARNADETVALGSEKQRSLLAILLLHANEVVSAEQLIDGLWGERPPPTALRTLQAHISRLRKALDHHAGAPVNDNGEPPTGAPNGALVTRGHGYLLRVAPGELDLDRFTGLLEQGRQALAAGDPGTAAQILREGLDLWRGPPLADFTYDEGEQYPADPPTVEEIVAVMRTISDRVDGHRLRALIVCSGARDYGSAKRWRCTRPIWTGPAAPYSSGTARAASAARSVWTAGHGSNSIRGWGSVVSSRSAQCCA